MWFISLHVMHKMGSVATLHQFNTGLKDGKASSSTNFELCCQILGSNSFGPQQLFNAEVAQVTTLVKFNKKIKQICAQLVTNRNLIVVYLGYNFFGPELFIKCNLLKLNWVRKSKSCLQSVACYVLVGKKCRNFKIGG